MVVKKHEVNLCVNKVIHVKRLAQCQAHSKDSMLGTLIQQMSGMYLKKLQNNISFS